MKKKEIKPPTSGTIYLDEGDTLASIMSQLMAVGVTDLSKVKFDRDYVGCQCDHGDSYCYCPSSYTDMRFRWEA